MNAIDAGLAPGASIAVEAVTKRFGDFTALDAVSLAVAEGELVALLGPSGSGKTTLLRIIAGLEFPSAGAVHFHGREATMLSAAERQVGFVFQHYALFRHMTVADNVAFGLEVRGRAARPSKAAIRERVHELLGLVQLSGLAERYPSQLSGGQRQRVALARALAIEPRVLLLDEPFGALDAQVRKDLRRWLRKLHDELGMTGVFVTHDQEEALEVADRVVVMNHGRIEQIGSPTEIYDDPASPFVYQFLGNVNSLPCRAERHGADVAGLRLQLDARHPGASAGTAFIRPHDVVLMPESADDGVPARLRHATVLGPTVRLELELGGGAVIEAETTRQQHAALGLRAGAPVRVKASQARLFLDDGTRVTARDLPPDEPGWP